MRVIRHYERSGVTRNIFALMNDNRRKLDEILFHWRKSLKSSVDFSMDRDDAKEQPTEASGSSVKFRT